MVDSAPMINRLGLLVVLGAVRMVGAHAVTQRSQLRPRQMDGDEQNSTQSEAA